MPGPKGTITLPGPGGLIGGVIPRRRTSSAFSPTQVAGLSLWLDSSDPSTLFQDSALTTPASADGDPVGGWKDKSGNGRHVSQGTSSARPLLKLSVQNSKNVIRFDGTDDFLGRAAIGLGSGNFTVLTVNNRGATSRTVLSEGSSGGNTPLTLFGFSSGGDLLGNCRDDAGTEVSAGVFTAASDSAWHVNAFRRTGAAFKLWVDAATATASATLSTQTVNQLGVGCLCRVVNSQFFGGDLAEVQVYAASVSDADLALLSAQLKAKWGTP